MQVRGLFYHAQALDHVGRCNHPAHAESRKGHLREAIDLHHDVRAIELLQRSQTISARHKARVDMVLDNGNLVPRRNLQ